MSRQLLLTISLHFVPAVNDLFALRPEYTCLSTQKLLTGCEGEGGKLPSKFLADETLELPVHLLFFYSTHLK
jgi:hypothetical protein